MANACKVVLFLLVSLAAFGQGSRFDNFAWTTAPVGNLNVLVPVPGSTIAVCNYPANATPCTNYANIYTDATLTTLINQAVTPVTADSQGNWGFWAASLAYQYTICTPSASCSGPYNAFLPLGYSASGGASVQILNSIYFADRYPSITAAVTAAGSTGWVLIPKDYIGTDTYTSGNKNVIDLRNNFFGVYQYIAPSRPITGYPLGNDLALDVDGPADLVLANGDLGSAITTTSTAITAATPTTITVGDSSKFSIAAAYARIDPGKGDGVDDFCALNSIADSTHMNVTCVYNHSGTVDVWQKGNLVAKGFSSLNLVPTQPANLSTYKFPFYIGSSYATLMSIGINPSDPWPHNGIAFSEALTGMTTSSANHFPTANHLNFRNASAIFQTRIEDSSGNVMMEFPDGFIKFVSPLVDETSGCTPATAGTMRLCNQHGIEWRNSGNTLNYIVALDSSDNLDLGSSNAVVTPAGKAIFNGGIQAGASGSTVSDTRELVQSAHSCGTTTTCANTANGAYREVFGTVALTAGTATVTGITAYTSTSTFGCSGTDQTAAAAVKVVPASTTSITITGTASDVIFYRCIGN